mmetsp:Transcript_122110/g.171873  ORF Transcript_122110/g.171873 Transcript_122110/m.171873 type:complete len:120 (+) Transcript_122110:2-361(+)
MFRGQAQAQNTISGLVLARFRRKTAMAEAAEVDFNVGAKGKKQLVDNKLDTMFRGGKVDSYFKVSQRGSNLTTEIRAGITTFLTAAYIMAVNPNILSTTGLKFEGLVFATAGSSCIAPS